MMNYCRPCVVKWPGWQVIMCQDLDLVNLNSVSGLVSRLSWWTGWTTTRTWFLWGCALPPCLRLPDLTSRRAMCLCPASSFLLPKPSSFPSNIQTWLENLTKVRKYLYFYLFRLAIKDVIISNTNSRCIHYLFLFVVCIDTMPTIVWLLPHSWTANLIMTNIILCSSKCFIHFKYLGTTHIFKTINILVGWCPSGRER